jgi:hypothetical protein
VNDVKDLLGLALADGHGPDPAAAADPAGDLARGRSLLQRRRLYAVAGGAAVVAAAVLVPLGLTTASHGPAAAPRGQAASTVRPSGPAGTRPPATRPAATKIALIAYQGRQVPGYQVAEVPSGWVIQGGDPFALVIARRGDHDHSIDSFVGKLVVMLQSRDASPPASGKPQPVAGRPGRFDVQGDTQILTYQIAGGRWMVVQAPTSLGWDSSRVAEFAAGVKVLANAQQSRG